MEMKWSSIVRLYMSDSFPVDERSHDETLTNEPSQLSFPEQYDMALPLGWFRINQGIENFYIPERNEEIQMPNYIPLQKEALADEQQRASYSNHKRVYFNKQLFLNKVCEREKAPFVFGNQRIVSLMHERNMPFEIPCMTCSKKLSLDNVVNTFYLLPQRDVFAPVQLRDRIDTFSTSKQPSENEQIREKRHETKKRRTTSGTENSDEDATENTSKAKPTKSTGDSESTKMEEITTKAKFFAAESSTKEMKKISITSENTKKKDTEIPKRTVLSKWHKETSDSLKKDPVSVKREAPGNSRKNISSTSNKEAPGSSKPSNSSMQHKPAMDQRLYYRIPFAALLYTFAAKKFTDPSNQDKQTMYRGPFLADRWWDSMVFERRGFLEALPEPDGRLRVNPDPGRLLQYYPHFNSMTLVCAQVTFINSNLFHQQVDGTLIETDVLVNVDTLIEEPEEEDPECLYRVPLDEHKKQKCVTKHTSFDERRYDISGKLDDRYHIRDYRAVPKGFKAVLNLEFNLKIDIGYEPWSCCTACCCTKESCGREYALDSDQCKQLESYRTRIAYMSFFKIDPVKKVNMPPDNSNDTKHWDEVLMTFDKYLSSDPYFTTGIPVHSTLLTANTYWRKLRRILFEKMIDRNIAAKNVKGNLGLYVETENCDDLKQKKDCRLLDECRKEAQGMIVTSEKRKKLKTPEKETRKIEFVGCKDEITIEKISLNGLETFESVKLGSSYIININETLFGTTIKVAWNSGMYQIPPYNEKLPCSSQRIAVTPDQKGLLIVGARKEDTRWPYVAKATMVEDGSDAYFKIILTYISPESEDATGTLWAAILSVIFAALSILLLTVREIWPEITKLSISTERKDVVDDLKSKKQNI